MTEKNPPLSNPQEDSTNHLSSLVNRIKQEYASISPFYKKLKKKPWKDLLPLFTKLSFPETSSILDLGGGNGRNSEFFPNTQSLTVILDLSLSLLKEASPIRERVCASMTHLPFRSLSFNRVISIAVFHHLPDTRERKEALLELQSSLQPGSIVFLTVWKRDRKGMYGRTIKLMLEGKDPRIYHHPWKTPNGEIVTHRQYFLFTRKDLLSMVPPSYEVLDDGSFGGNDRRSNYFLVLRLRSSGDF